MKIRWGTVVLVGFLSILALAVFAGADAVTMKPNAGGKVKCEVVGLAQGKGVFNDVYSSIWLECPQTKRKRAVESRVSDPKKFTVGGHASCELVKMSGGITGTDYTKTDGVLEKCEPA